MANEVIHIQESPLHGERKKLPIRLSDNGDGTYSMAGGGAAANGGIPNDVSRKLRIEGHNQSLVGGNVWHDIWEGGAAVIPEPEQVVGEQLAISSSSANDTLLGVGIRRIQVDFLTVEQDGLYSEIIDLNGLAESLTVATNITDIIDMHAIEVGTGGFADGIVDLHRVGDGAHIFSRISSGGNKSMTTLRHLLPTSTFYITNAVISGDTKGIDVQIRSDATDSGVVHSGVWMFAAPLTITDAPATIAFNPALEIPPGGRLKVSARGTAGGNSVSVIMNGWVKV